MGGSDWQDTAYTCEEVAKLKAKSLEAEWINYRVHPVKVRVLSEFEGAVDRALVRIDHTTIDEWHARVGLAKLTKEERKALGLTYEAI